MFPDQECHRQGIEGVAANREPDMKFAKLFRAMVPDWVKEFAIAAIRDVARDEAINVSREESLIGRDMACLMARDEAAIVAEAVARSLIDQKPGRPGFDSPQRAGEENVGSRARELYLYGRLLDTMMGSEPWAIDHVRISDDQLEIRGWALSPNNDAESVLFTMNGKPFATMEYPNKRPETARVFWFRPGAVYSGFVCRSPYPRPRAEDRSELRFECVRRDTMEPVRTGQTYYYQLSRDDLPLPDEIRRRRAHGGESESSFRLEGYTIYRKLEETLGSTFNHGFADYRNILDWGCGCGRIARYFIANPENSVIGVDVDEDNVKWCKENLPFGEYHTIGLHPPTVLPDGSFDLVIGISVFSHLRKDEQFHWLEELHRLTSSGSLLLISILGEHAISRARLTIEEFQEFEKHGFSDSKRNPDLSGKSIDEEYYRNTFHSSQYIQKHWGSYFRIVDHIDAYVGNLQDLVILQKR
jgi:hypothetical protein